MYSRAHSPLRTLSLSLRISLSISLSLVSSSSSTHIVPRCTCSRRTMILIVIQILRPCCRDRRPGSANRRGSAPIVLVRRTESGRPLRDARPRDAAGACTPTRNSASTPAPSSDESTGADARRMRVVVVAIRAVGLGRVVEVGGIGVGVGVGVGTGAWAVIGGAGMRGSGGRGGGGGLNWDIEGIAWTGRACTGRRRALRVVVIKLRVRHGGRRARSRTHKHG
jgi:hypothetical protein